MNIRNWRLCHIAVAVCVFFGVLASVPLTAFIVIRHDVPGGDLLGATIGIYLGLAAAAIISLAVAG
jgi:hypothetical protein